MHIGIAGARPFYITPSLNGHCRSTTGPIVPRSQKDLVENISDLIATSGEGVNPSTETTSLPLTFVL